MLEAMLGQEQIYQSFALAETEIEKQLGTPICVPNCGKCCEVTVPLARRIEAQYLAGYAAGAGITEKLVSLCEGWLLERHSCAPTYRGPLFGSVTPHLQKEFEALAKSPCPLLSADKRCLLHGGRPLVCRAYGVTHMPGPEVDFCPRQLGKGETFANRAYLELPEFKRIVTEFYQSLPDKDLLICGLLPSLLYKILRPQKWQAAIADGKIATAKLIGSYHYAGMLWQSQMDKEYTRAGGRR